jgi:hypothetical protein
MRTAIPSTSRSLSLAGLVFSALPMVAQVVNEDDLRKQELRGNDAALVALEYVPEGGTVWALVAQGDRIQEVDTATWSVRRSIPLQGFGQGAALTASPDGRYMLLKGSPPPSSPDKRREAHLAVLEVRSGAVVLDVPQALDGCLIPGQEALATLNEGQVTIHDFHGGSRSMEVPGAAWALAVDPSGERFAVSRHPGTAELEQVPSMRNDRKNMKAALKYRQMVSVHRLQDGAPVRWVPAVYDLVQDLRYSTDGEVLLVHSVADPRSGIAAGGHLELVRAKDQEPLRPSFMSWTARPVPAISPDGRTLALGSTEGRNKRKLTLYELATGSTLLMIDLEQKRRYDKAEGEMHDARLGYTWLPDGRLLVAQGPAIGCYRP